ncbi:probable splicing factor 3A subunit 1 [Elaeis guineensis]|uniref:Probable splicing factor 3A subunit 1 n=1 Tax=Elaeis guineensis var. tenera TaxID=51953 RepID=A0A6I9RUW1_ELAGV|nr:probable splicing factor 3A subunit 1 [Elaeis guineensis]
MIGAILPLPAPPSDGNLGPIPPAQLPDENNDDNKAKEDQPAAAPAPAVATHTRTIGIIHPPPDIRMIIEKTATFVAKNGPEFEKRILANNAGNAKFNFLIPSDPYHAYYQHRVSEFRSQIQSSQPPAAGADSSQQQQQLQPPPPPDSSAPAAPSGDSAAKPDPAAPFRIPPRKVLEPPEAEQYTVRLPEGITGEELDIIKLTAQFVARNGKGFLNSLSTREATNPQFHFLRPTHSMFTFFTALTDAYSKVLMPPKGVAEKLRNGVTDMTTVLERCLHRLEWERSQEQARQKAEDEIEQERLQMAMIDWHDFVVVETIEFADDEDEELPMPMTLEEVIRRSKMSALDDQGPMETVEPGKEVEMEMDEEEVQLVEEGMRAARLDENGEDENKRKADAAPADEPEPPMRIVKNWKRPEERIPAERDPTKFVISPITGELIPINEMAEHMRISLIDPKYKEQKERMMAKIRETTLAADDEISRNIVGLARTRPDIFGTTEEEVSNAVKAEIAKKKDEQPKQVIWDGHSSSIGRTATQALSQSLSGEEQADANNTDAERTLPGPAPPPPKPGVPSVRPLPPPPGLVLNIPRFPPSAAPYSAAAGGGMVAPPPRPGIGPMIPSVRPPAPPMPMSSAQQPVMMSRPPMPPAISVNPPTIPVPPPPGSQFTPLVAPRPFMPMPPPNMPMVLPPPLPQGMPPPPPPEEAPPPLPDEPEPKRQRTDDVSLVPEDQFLAQHPGPVRVSVSVPNVDEGNLKGQLLEIMIQSLSETVGSLKEKIAGEIQLPANKQKLSSRAGFLKDNLTLAYYNIGPGETLTLALRERGGRKK